MHEAVAIAALTWHVVLVGALLYRTATTRSRVRRALCVDTAALVITGFLSILAVVRFESAYLDVALTMALLGFAGTVAVGRFVDQERGKR